MNNLKIKIAKISTLLIMTTVFLISLANADALEASYSSISYGVLSQEAVDDMRLSVTSKSDVLIISDQTTGKATGKTREEIQSIKEALLDTPSMSRSYAPEFTIYNAFTTLYDDFDQDGYYQTLSVVFDADIYSYDGNDLSEVYALLYLSENGGPWVHYYTTDDFLIHSDSDKDEYAVITTFLQGYHPGYYDLLIDLYQIGNPNIVASFSSDDSSALYALPLESNDHDQVYVESIYIHHGGSFSALLLILLLLPLALRLFPAKLRGNS